MRVNSLKLVIKTMLIMYLVIIPLLLLGGCLTFKLGTYLFNLFGLQL